MIPARTGVNFCLVRDGKILLQQRDESCPSYPNYWCIPGGAQEPGESLLETTLREIDEEYGLSITSAMCKFLIDRPENNPGKVFLCIVPKDQEPILREGKAMGWFPIEAISNMELGFRHNEIIVPFLRKYMEKLSSESRAEFKVI